jgi:hypothetical protein
MIPKIIWSYWNDSHIPHIVKICQKSWIEHHPDHTIILMSKENFGHYVDIPENMRFIDSDAHFADILRILVIEKYGGFWFDASIMCFAHLKTVFDVSRSCEFNGYFMDNFTTNPKYPVIENWLFGAPANSRFMQAWRKELFKASTFDSNMEYVDHVKAGGVDIQDIPYPEYLTMHIAAQTVLQKANANPFRMCVKSVYEGPFKLLGDAGWDIQQAKKLLSTNGEQYKQSFLKFRGVDRPELSDADILLLL